MRDILHLMHILTSLKQIGYLPKNGPNRQFNNTAVGVIKYIKNNIVVTINGSI